MCPAHLYGPEELTLDTEAFEEGAFLSFTATCRFCAVERVRSTILDGKNEDGLLWFRRDEGWDDEPPCPPEWRELTASQKAATRYKQKRLAGLCGLCGEPALLFRSTCAAHCVKHDNERQRIEYRALKEQALCVKCGQNTDGRSRCDACEQVHAREQRALRSRRAETGLCAICGQRPGWNGTRRCEECREKRRAHNRDAQRRWHEAHPEKAVEYARAARDRASAQGLCTKCQKVPARDGTTRCDGCHEKNAEQVREAQARAKDAGLCSICQKNPLATATRCAKCNARRRSPPSPVPFLVAAPPVSVEPVAVQVISLPAAASLPPIVLAPLVIDPRDQSRLTREQSYELARLAHAGNADARARLVASCEGLARKLARRYARITPHLTDDLLSAARCGLLQAVEHYKPDMGASFATYAQFHVRNHCAEVIRRQRWAVTLPNHGRRLVDFQVSSRSMFYVNEDGEDVELPIAELRTEDAHGDVLFRERIRGYLDQLTIRQRTVIEARFVEDETLVQIAGRMGCSPERVRQIETAALARLRELMEAPAVATTRDRALTVEDAALEQRRAQVPPPKPKRETPLPGRHTIFSDAVAELRNVRLTRRGQSLH